MEEFKRALESLLESKAKLMADRNERFAVINQEMASLKVKVSSEVNELKDKIRSAIQDDRIASE